MEDSSLSQPSAASRDMMIRLLGKNLSPAGAASAAGADSAAVVGDLEQRHSEAHPVSSRK